MLTFIATDNFSLVFILACIIWCSLSISLTANLVKKTH